MFSCCFPCYFSGDASLCTSCAHMPSNTCILQYSCDKLGNYSCSSISLSLQLPSTYRHVPVKQAATNRHDAHLLYTDSLIPAKYAHTTQCSNNAQIADIRRQDACDIRTPTCSTDLWKGFANLHLIDCTIEPWLYKRCHTSLTCPATAATT